MLKITDVKLRVWNSFVDSSSSSIWSLPLGYLPPGQGNYEQGLDLIMQTALVLVGDLGTWWANHKSFLFILFSVEHLHETDDAWVEKSQLLTNHRSPEGTFASRGRQRRGFVPVYWSGAGSLRM